MLQFITNTNQTHLSVLKKMLKGAKEVYISVAFLKITGLSRIFCQLEEAGSVFIIAGASYGLTDPDALTKILDYQNLISKVKGYLSKMDSTTVFHPKLYLTTDGVTGNILIGSANLTDGGMQNNNECSLLHQCSITDPVWIDAIQYFKTCISVENAYPLSRGIIARYREFHKRQKKARIGCEATSNVNNLFYHLKVLKERIMDLERTSIEAELKAKRKYYRQAKEILEVIVDKKHSRATFIELLEDLVGKPGSPGLWYSNGLFRHKTKLFDQQENFRALIRSIKSNIDHDPETIYTEARSLINGIDGVGPNFIGEIMMTYNPERFANINRNPITVLTEVGRLDIKNHSQKFNGADYREYNDIITELAHDLGIKDMLEVDLLLDRIYRQWKKEQKPKN